MPLAMRCGGNIILQPYGNERTVTKRNQTHTYAPFLLQFCKKGVKINCKTQQMEENCSKGFFSCFCLSRKQRPQHPSALAKLNGNPLLTGSVYKHYFTLPHQYASVAFGVPLHRGHARKRKEKRKKSTK